ncbi:Nucleotide-binding universal stress protein, UspA family [Halorientalis persicus]|jgi:nucleotide-binding universal stress UspA family protein|uniref:Nucleotide-binding universal stress protein, UspA family n=1 Tax=Halorientalis persicus TaxID=1367881 RepID=A0A1H8EXJ8_9EURY|nr:universal stress protein [Halorientalis persicus]SEN24223.1 Nucleotide-binding universal stress protein, UspA family [Halorientalis persicus]
MDVLVPMDDSEMAEHALEYALDVFDDAEITVLTVVGEPSIMWGEAAAIAIADDMQEAAEEHGQTVADRAGEIAADHDTEVDVSVRTGHPSRAILDAAEDYDTIVLGSHGGSVADRLMVGNVAETVFRRAPVPVTVVR